MKRKFKSALAIVLSVAVMFTFIPVMGTAAMAASKAKTPKNLKCTYKELTSPDFTKGMAKISWSKSSGAKGYKVYYKKGSKYKSLGTTSKASYTLKNLNEGKKYTIKVKAFKKKSRSKTYSSYSKALNVKVSKKELGVKAQNGNMIGTVKNGVYSYKGVHYAQDAGTPENRWKKPVPVEASDEDVDASEYGNVALQVPWHSEAPSVETDKQDEDCLTVDVWTKSPNDTDAKKPVFVWIHGGSNILGGSSDPLYSGQNLIEACGDDVVYVAINYRLNCMGIMNFSKVEGGEEYPDAGWLSLYDDIEALKWIQKNIKQFGGDPDQVTIAGESAGGAHAALLPLMDECKDGNLFNKTIVQSGGYVGATLEENSYGPTKIMLDGYKNEESVATEKHAAVKGLGKKGHGKDGNPTMDDLANLSDKEMWTLMYYCGCCAWDEESQRAYSVTDSTGAYNGPIRGGQDNPLLNAVFDPSLEKIAEQYKDIDNIDVMIGTTANEYDYWIGESSNKYQTDENGEYKTYIAPDGTEKRLVEEGASPTDYDYAYFNDSMEAGWITKYSLFEKFGIGEDINAALEKTTEGNTGAKKGVSKEAMKASMLATEASCAIPSQMLANSHSKSDGKTYMYYWKHPSTTDGFNAGHAVELSYVFGISSKEYKCPASGTTDDALVYKTMKTWMSFVKDGEPAVANQEETEWPQYDAEKKATMVINDTAINKDWTVENDPDNEIRDLMTNKDGKQNPVKIGGKEYTSYMDYVLNAMSMSEGSK